MNTTKLLIFFMINMATSSSLISHFFILIGPSGAGKTTLISRLQQHMDLEFLATTTTRPMRPGEINGKDYHFINYQEFEVAKEDFIQPKLIYNNWYGISKSAILTRLTQQDNFISVITADTAQFIKDLWPNHVTTIFITAPSVLDLEKRLMQRQGDSAQSIAKRLANAPEEMKLQDTFDYKIINGDSIDQATQKLLEIIHKYTSNSIA